MDQPSLRLLFITPKIDERHDDLAFASLWVRAFERAGFSVTVICGEKGVSTLTCPVYSIDHVPGASRLRTFIRFQKLILALKYDRVFVHLGQRWLGAGAWWWRLCAIPAYLWYTHYTNPLSLRIGLLATKRMFAATKDSLPQYDQDPRKIVTGHGIDTEFWNVSPVSDTEREPATHLLAVHRLSRSKRLDLALRVLALLPKTYRLTHYGRPQDPVNDAGYVEELHALVRDLGLSDRVRFMGSLPMDQLRSVYPRFRVFINLVPRTIDKTVLEAMYCGLTPVIGQDQAVAIGYPHAPVDDRPETIARFIEEMQMKSPEELRNIVDERHGLDALIEKMAVYIRPGT